MIQPALSIVGGCTSYAYESNQCDESPFRSNRTLFSLSFSRRSHSYLFFPLLPLYILPLLNTLPSHPPRHKEHRAARSNSHIKRIYHSSVKCQQNIMQVRSMSKSSYGRSTRVQELRWIDGRSEVVKCGRQLVQEGCLAKSEEEGAAKELEEED